MTSEEARALFSAAYDGEMTSDQRAAFEQLLGEDASLRQEYDEFRRVLSEAQSLAEEADDELSVDLVARVQSRLRARSRGRFFRDRFSEQSRAQGLVILWMSAVILLLLALTWFALYFVDVG